MRYLVLLLCGLFVLVGCASQATYGDPITEGEPTPIPTPIVPTKPEYQVTRGDIAYRREFTGRVEPIVSQELLFRIGGQVGETFFSAGDDVQAGDVIAVQDTGILEEQLLEAQANLAAAQSLLTTAQQEKLFDRQRAQLNLELAQLRVDHAVAQAESPPTTDERFQIRSLEIERDLAQLNLDELNDDIEPELQLAVNRAENVLEEIESQLDDTRLIAPMDGRLMVLDIDPGEFAEAFETVGVIADVSALEVQDVLTGNEMNEMVEGMTVQMHLASQPGQTMPGTLVSLPQPYGQGADDAAHVRFDDAEQAAALNIGDRITVSVLIDEREDVLWLPVAAVRQFGGRDFVVIRTGGIQQRIDVELGLEGDGRVEILEGLEVDQTVIAA